MRETLLIKHSFLPFFSIETLCFNRHFHVQIKILNDTHLFEQNFVKMWEKHFWYSTVLAVFSTKTKCFGRIYPCTYYNTEWNTFVLVELYKNVRETLLIKHSSCCFFLPKQSVLIEFLHVHIKILTKTHLFQ